MIRMLNGDFAADVLYGADPDPDYSMRDEDDE